MATLPDKRLSELPNMTRWFDPLLLGKALLHVVLSKWFGQYADRRLIHAALDTVPKQEIIARARLTELVPDEEGAIWIDYVADVADGFDSTYAIAFLMAAEKLEIDGHTTRRGQVLLMGGDEVYPLASRANYEDHLIYPYERAFPESTQQNVPHTPLFAIPGNHDWYDGLNIFLAYFCRPRGKKIGSWQTKQRRSYFAIQITAKWWVWAIDIQLAEDMDQPQADYFETIADQMDADSIVILCTAVPGWYTPDPKKGAFAVIGYAAWKTEQVNKNIKIAAVLSGDTHHYCRYSSDDFGVQFITSGGGGAFLHPTHNLKDTIKIEWLKTKPELSLKTEPGEGHAASDVPACYPNRATSRMLLLGFPLFNWEFALVFGIIYATSSLAGIRWGPASYWVVGAIFSLALLGYTLQQEGRTIKVLLSIPHALVHVVAIWMLAEYFVELNEPLRAPPLLFFFALSLEMLLAGMFFGGLIFGIYLSLTSLFADMSHNDAFSALRLTSHKHFLRIRIKDDAATIFPICLDRVPKRHQWQVNLNRKDSTSISAIVPTIDLKRRLIEKPISVNAPLVQRVPPPEKESEILPS